MIFVGVAADTSSPITKRHVILMASFSTTIACGLFLVFTSNQTASYLWMITSNICFLPSFYILREVSKSLKKLLDDTMIYAHQGAAQRKLLLASRQLTLLNTMGYLSPLFPTIYFLRFSRIINNDFACAGWLIAGLLIKTIFSSMCMDAHLEVSHKSLSLIDFESFNSNARRSFLRYVFHEVRVPLNAVALGLQILANSGHLDDYDYETLIMMKEASSYIGSTLNDVMALQKIEEGALKLVMGPFNVQEMLDSVANHFVDACREKSITIRSEIASNVSKYLIGDRFRIKHVLINILDNAVNVSPTGSSVEILVRCGEFIQDDQTHSIYNIWFSIIDHGVGIRDHQQNDDIFKPFRNLKHGDYERNRGSGLGLAISREIVHLHGGSINYTSSEGFGTTFNVVLPLSKISDSDVEIIEADSAAGAPFFKPLIRNGSHMNVLMTAYSPRHPKSYLRIASSADGRSQKTMNDEKRSSERENNLFYHEEEASSDALKSVSSSLSNSFDNVHGFVSSQDLESLDRSRALKELNASSDAHETTSQSANPKVEPTSQGLAAKTSGSLDQTHRSSDSLEKLCAVLHDDSFETVDGFSIGMINVAESVPNAKYHKMSVNRSNMSNTNYSAVDSRGNKEMFKNIKVLIVDGKTSAHCT